jgi:uncharacterized protein YndB with AHSA1/START domain
MPKRIILALIAFVAALVGFVALQPSTFRVERATIVVAPIEQVFAEVNDLHNWEHWSPWAKLDPNASATFEGPASGEGAVFKWAGNEKIGEGSMTLTESRPNERVKIRIDFVKPWVGTQTSEFAFKPDGPRTIVTWTVSAENSFLGKAVSVVKSPDSVIGGLLERGLANLKRRAEGKSG